MTKNAKRYLMLIAAVGLIAIAAGSSGTFATFNAEVTNSGNSFAAGTLFLHQTPHSGTTCESEGVQTAGLSNTNTGTNSTNVATCTALFNNIDLSNLPAGGKTIDLALNDAGSLPASNIEFNVPSCSWGKNNGSAPTFVSLPSDCSDVYVTIEETNSSYGTPIYCAYGTASGNACAAASSANTLADSAITGTSWSPLLHAAATDATLDASGGSNDTRYYVITIDPVVGSGGNSLQNLKLTFDLAWQINQ